MFSFSFTGNKKFDANNKKEWERLTDQSTAPYHVTWSGEGPPRLNPTGAGPRRPAHMTNLGGRRNSQLQHSQTGSSPAGLYRNPNSPAGTTGQGRSLTKFNLTARASLNNNVPRIF